MWNNLKFNAKKGNFIIKYWSYVKNNSTIEFTGSKTPHFDTLLDQNFNNFVIKNDNKIIFFNLKLYGFVTPSIATLMKHLHLTWFLEFWNKRPFSILYSPNENPTFCTEIRLRCWRCFDNSRVVLVAYDFKSRREI